MLTLDNSISISFNNMGLFSTDEKWIHPKRVIKSYEIIYVVEGRIYIDEDDKETLEDPEANVSYMMGESKVFHADVFLKDEQELDLAGFHIRVLHTPGHTKGGCCYYFPYEDVLFSGDTLFCTSVGRTDFKGGSSSELIRSIKEKLMVLPDRTTVYPGHNDVTSIENERMYNPYL